MHKRIMTFVSAIIATLVMATSTIYAIVRFPILVVGMSNIPIEDRTPAYEGAIALTIVISLFILAIVVTCLVLNACSLRAYQADNARYAKMKGTIIAAAVFNFILAIFGFVLLAAKGITALHIVLFVISGLILIAAGVLYIVELCLEPKRVAKAAAAAQAEETKTEHTNEQ